MPTILDHLRQKAAAAGEATAVVAGATALTYRRLDDLSGRAAAALRRRGVKKGDCVGISYDHDWRAAVSVIAVLKAGAAYVPLNLAYPAARLAWLRQDAGIKLELGGGGGLDLAALAAEENSAADGLPPVTGADRLAVIYTSGSTGQPKGVVLTHGNPETVGKAYEKFFELRGGDRLASYVSLSFMMGFCDIYGAIKTGAELHVLPPEVLPDPRGAAAYFDRRGIKAAMLPLAFGRKLVEQAELPKIRALAFCGERFIK
ncbi:MAG: AMP-binding protein, partial [Gracilibacteraceae bacterium]|nr:AMP-binding protein [Gracilibacteraceae bacterium]